MSNISNMERRGIFRSTFKVGDTVTVKIHPLRDGRAGGNYTSVTTAEDYRPDGIVDEKVKGDPGYCDANDARPWASHYAIGEKRR